LSNYLVEENEVFFAFQTCCVFCNVETFLCVL